jgi:hypothetical protein
MTPQEEVAENLLLHQLDFLCRSLPASAHAVDSDTTDHSPTPSSTSKEPS